MLLKVDSSTKINEGKTIVNHFPPRKLSKTFEFLLLGVVYPKFGLTETEDLCLETLGHKNFYIFLSFQYFL